MTFLLCVLIVSRGGGTCMLVFPLPKLPSAPGAPAQHLCHPERPLGRQGNQHTAGAWHRSWHIESCHLPYLPPSSHLHPNEKAGLAPGGKLKPWGCSLQLPGECPAAGLGISGGGRGVGFLRPVAWLSPGLVLPLPLDRNCSRVGL